MSSLYPPQIKYRLRLSCIQRNSLISKVTSYYDNLEGWGTSLLYPPNPSQVPRAFGHFDGGLPGEEARVCDPVRGLLVPNISEEVEGVTFRNVSLVKILSL